MKESGGYYMRTQTLLSKGHKTWLSVSLFRVIAYIYKDLL